MEMDYSITLDSLHTLGIASDDVIFYVRDSDNPYPYKYETRSPVDIRTIIENLANAVNQRLDIFVHGFKYTIDITINDLPKILATFFINNKADRYKYFYGDSKYPSVILYNQLVNDCPALLDCAKLFSDYIVSKDIKVEMISLNIKGDGYLYAASIYQLINLLITR